MVVQHFRRIDLPHLNEQKWQKLKHLYSQLNEIQTAKNLAEVLERLFREAGNDIEVHAREPSIDVLNSNSTGTSRYFEGLSIFLEEIATEEERETFFSSILPFIVTLASSIDEFSPSEGILLCSQQRESGVVLDRRFIACILASAFLCVLPSPPDDAQVRSINFVNLFACFHREEIQRTQAAKLRCLIHYFESLINDWPDIRGRVFYSRQVIPSSSLPTLEDWMSCDLPLCPVIIDNRTAIEDSGEHMLQVDFANRFIGGGVLGAGHVQEEIRFCINPELLVALMFMEAMQDNECIVVRGVERFSSYSGYGKTFEFTGDFKDESQRDEDGNFQTTVVAIDATQFKSASRETQYEESALTRELNKALVGLYNPEVGSKIIQSPSELESEDSSVESEDQEISEETESATEETAAGYIQEFSDNLVNLALTEAFNEVDSNNNTAGSEDLVDSGDILTTVMKKSLFEVFGSTPEKARTYSENLLSPTPLPKCVTRTISGSNTPVIPGTPPSSPAVFDLKQTSLDYNGFHTFLSSPHTLSAKSFADSLSNSLMSCVELTSSIATAIAAAATSPVLAVADTKESFQKSPKDLGSPVKNGCKLISFLSSEISKSETPLKKTYSNGFNISEFVEDLSSVVKSSKSKRSGDDTDSCGEFNNVRQNLLEEFDHVKYGGKEKDELKKGNGDISEAKLFEKFATRLSGSIVDSAISSSVCSKEAKDETEIDELDDKETGSVPSDIPADISVLEGRVDALLMETMSAALSEAAVLCSRKTDDSMSSADEEGSGESDRLTQGAEKENNESEIQESDESDVSSSECQEEEQSDLREKITHVNTSSELSSTIPEAAVQTAEKLSEKIMFDGLAQAVGMMHGREVADGGDGYTREEPQLEGDETVAEESSFSDEEVTEEETLQSFAENLSSLTVRGAVEIAKANLRASAGGSRVRPVATGNWGCGVFRGDPELKAVIQWAAASAAGCPVLVYHTFGDKRISRLLKTLVCLHSRGWTISDVVHAVLRFSNSVGEGTVGHQKLLSYLCHTPQTSL